MERRTGGDGAVWSGSDGYRLAAMAGGIVTSLLVWLLAWLTVSTPFG